MTQPIIKASLKEINSPMTHDGLDLKVKASSVRVNPHDRTINDFEIVNRGMGFGNPVYETKRIVHLLDEAINKFYCSPGSVKEKTQEIQEASLNTQKTFVIPNAKYIKEIKETETGYDFYTVTQEVSPEVKQIAADLFQLLSLSKEAIEDKTIQVNNRMKIGTLDTDKNQKVLLIHTEDGPVPYTKDQVTQKQLITSLWFILRLHQTSKEFLKYINLEVEYKGYKAIVTKGEVRLDTTNQSELVLDIYQDLRNMEIANG